MFQFPPKRCPISTSQQTIRAKAPRCWKGREDGSWPERSSSLPTSHRAYPGMTRHFDMIQHSQSSIIVELTVPCEENMEEAFERKKLCWENLCMVCEDKWWTCPVMPIEVGFRGFISWTTISYLTWLGQTDRVRWRAKQQLQVEAERASSWIWSKVRKSTTSWQNHRPPSLLLYPHSILLPT